MHQILDDGRVTDSQGRTVSFKNCVLIMTSNLGSSVILEETDRSRQKDTVMTYVRNTFRPEFVNRIDEYIIFDSLRLDQIKEIVRLQVNTNNSHY